MLPRIAFLALLAMAFWGCERRLVVYSDPWLRAFAEEAVTEFEEAHPDILVELKFVSSEVIASHIRFGQPVDLFLCFNPDIVEKVGIQDELSGKIALAGEKMAFVEGKDQGKFKQFRTEGCLLREASQRPGRMLCDSLFPQIAGPCMLVADFQKQAEDYLLRGWVPQGVVPASFARRNPDKLRITAESEKVVAAYTAFITRKGRQNQDAEAFFRFLGSKKSAEMLARQSLFP